MSAVLLLPQASEARELRLIKATSPDVPGYSGDGQTANIKTPLSKPLRVKVLDENDKPVPNQTVDFVIASVPSKSKGTALASNQVTTDETGTALVPVTLGSKKGAYMFTARIKGAEGKSEVYFKAKGRKADWYLWMIFGLFGGLALFLYGMEMMSDGMKKTAGSRMRAILGALTGNRVIGLAVGAFVTMVIQSSSATTVMLVSFVQAQLMTFTQSLGVILGADIGTTVTAQLVAFKFTKYALAIIAVGFAIYMFGRKENHKYVGEAILGFGILFFGMSVMSDAMRPLRTDPTFISMMVQLEFPLWGILVGTLFTALVQSSSASTALVITLASQGLISLEAGIPLILGANVGTCITAGLASINTGREAKRVALAHAMFKVAGVLLFVFWIPYFAELVRWASPVAQAGLDHLAKASAEVPRQIANAHTVFNVSLAFVMLPFTAAFGRLILWILPDKGVPKSEEIIIHHLDESSLATPGMAMELARSEVRRMMRITGRMIDASVVPFVEKDGGDKPDSVHKSLTLMQGLELRERKIDYLDAEITSFLTRIGRNELSPGQSGDLFGMLSIVKDLESIADTIDKNLVPLVGKKAAIEHDFSDAGRAELIAYHTKIAKQASRCLDALGGERASAIDFERAKRVMEKAPEYRELEDEYRKAHFERITQNNPASLATHEIHMEIMDLLKQINMHEANVAKAIYSSMSWEDNRPTPNVATESAGA